MRVWTRVDKSRKSRERRDCSMSSLSQNIILFFGMFLAGKCTYIPTNNATKSKFQIKSPKFHQKSNIFKKNAPKSRFFTTFLLEFSGFASLESLVRLHKKVLQSCETFKVRDFVNPSLDIDLWPEGE